MGAKRRAGGYKARHGSWPANRKLTCSGSASNWRQTLHNIGTVLKEPSDAGHLATQKSVVSHGLSLTPADKGTLKKHAD